jgi:transposase
MLKRWDRIARFIDDGRICLTNNAAECALAEIVVVRRLRTRRRSRRGHGYADHDGEAQRRRSSGLARRRARPHRRPPAKPATRAVAMALEKTRPAGRRLSRPN